LPSVHKEQEDMLFVLSCSDVFRYVPHGKTDGRKKREKTMSEIHPEQLSEHVIREIERLGGVIEPPPANKVTIISTVVGDTALPEPMRQLLFDIRWPRMVPYCSKDDDYPQGVEFGWTTVEENYGYNDFDGNLPYTKIALDASQFLYFIRLWMMKMPPTQWFIAWITRANPLSQWERNAPRF
jgi:hypothetical protein